MLVHLLSFIGRQSDVPNFRCLCFSSECRSIHRIENRSEYENGFEGNDFVHGSYTTLSCTQRDESSTHAKILVRHVKDPYQNNGRNISGRNK